MTYSIQQTRVTTRVQRLFVAALALGLTAAAQAQPQKVTVPPTPSLITPPAGHTAFMMGHAKGTQGYICLPTSAGASTASWTVKGARPEATLFLGENFQIITHFLSPVTNPNDVAPNPLPFGNATWQSSLDSSRVWAQVFQQSGVPAVVIAGTDLYSCPNTGSISCLLLQAIGSDEGPFGGTTLSKTTFVQRLNTNGGTAPATGCFTSANVGNQSLVPYTADYFFYRKDK